MLSAVDGGMHLLKRCPIPCSSLAPQGERSPSLPSCFFNVASIEVVTSVSNPLMLSNACLSFKTIAAFFWLAKREPCLDRKKLFSRPQRDPGRVKFVDE